MFRKKNLKTANLFVKTTVLLKNIIILFNDVKILFEHFINL